MLAQALSKFAGMFFDPKHPRDPEILKLLRVGQPTNAGVRVDHDTVMAIPAIKRAVQIITDKMFGMPWYVFEEHEDGREYAKNHPSWKCVTRMGNSELSAPAIRQQLTQWAMIWGNGCGAIYRPNWPQGPVEIIPLMPDRTDLVRLTGLRGLSGDLYEPGELRYRSWISGKQYLFARDEVIHIKGLGDNPYWGRSIFDLMRDAIGGVVAKEEYSNRFFAQGGQPSGFIEMPGSLDEESEENYLRSLKNATHGLGSAHKFVLLEEGAKFKETSFDPQRSQMLEARQFDVRTLSNVASIKVHKLIDGANSAFASLEQANHEHIEDDIKPFVNKWKVEYNDKLLTDAEKDSMTHSIDVDDEALDYISYADRASGAVETYNNGLTTKDESRRKLNYGPSRAPRAKQYRIPANIMYEDDQAMIATQRQQQAPQEPAPANDKSTELNEVTEAYLSKISVRLRRTASDKAGRSSKEFITWLDELKPEQGPQSIQPQIDQMFCDFSTEMNGIASKAKSDQELKELLCTT